MFLSLRNSAILCALWGLKKLPLRTQSVRKVFRKGCNAVVETNPLLPRTIEFVATLPNCNDPLDSANLNHSIAELKKVSIHFIPILDKNRVANDLTRWELIIN